MCGFLVIIGVSVCFLVWRVVMAKPRRGCRGASGHHRTPRSTPRDSENCHNRVSNIRDGAVNIINVTGSDGNIQSAYEEQLFRGRRILIELPLYSSTGNPLNTQNEPPTVEEHENQGFLSNDAIHGSCESFNVNENLNYSLPGYSPPPSYQQVHEDYFRAFGGQRNEEIQTPASLTSRLPEQTRMHEVQQPNPWNLQNRRMTTSSWSWRSLTSLSSLRSFNTERERPITTISLPRTLAKNFSIRFRDD